MRIVPQRSSTDSSFITRKYFNKQSTSNLPITIPVPAGNYIEVSLTGMNTSAVMDLVLRSPSNQMIFQGISQANYQFFGTWASDALLQSSSVEIGINWLWRTFQGSESDGTIEQTSANSYTISFEDIGVVGTATEQYIDGDDLQLVVSVHPLPVIHHYDFDIAQDTIDYYWYTMITNITPKDENNQVVQISPGMNISVSFSLPQFGNLDNYVEYGPVVTTKYEWLQEGLFFFSEGEIPSEVTTGSISVYTTSDPNQRGERSITITPVIDHLEVTAAPNTIGAGESSTLHVTAKDGNDNSIPVDGSAILNFEYSPDTLGRIQSGLTSTQDPGYFNGLEQYFALKESKNINQRKLKEKSHERSRQLKSNAPRTMPQMHSSFGSGGSTTFSEANNGTLKFIADGSVPETPTTVSVTFSMEQGSIASGTGTIIVGNELGCPVVSITPATLNAGDTAIITVKKKLENETVVDYLAGTQFTFTLISGQTYGVIVGNTSPAMFITNNSIDVDSAVVTIYAALGGGGAAVTTKNGLQKTSAIGCVQPVASVVVKDCEIESFSCDSKSLKIEVQKPSYSDFESDLPGCHKEGYISFGHTGPYPSRKEFNPSTCYGTEAKKWFLKGGDINVKIRTSICYEEAASYKLININSIGEVNENNYDCVLKTFEYREYPFPFDPLAGHVWSSEGTKIHEMVHVEEQPKLINDCYYGREGMASIEEMLRNVTIPKCDAKNTFVAKNEMKNQITKVYNQFVKNMEYYFGDKIYREGNPKNAERKFYDRLIRKVIDKAKKNNWTKVNNCNPQ